MSLFLLCSFAFSGSPTPLVSLSEANYRLRDEFFYCFGPPMSFDISGLTCAACGSSFPPHSSKMAADSGLLFFFSEWSFYPPPTNLPPVWAYLAGSISSFSTVFSPARMTSVLHVFFSFPPGVLILFLRSVTVGAECFSSLT